MAMQAINYDVHEHSVRVSTFCRQGGWSRGHDGWLRVLNPGLSLVKQGCKGWLCCSLLLLLPLLTALLLLSNILAEVIKDLAALLWLVYGLVACITKKLWQLPLPPREWRDLHKTQCLSSFSLRT